QSLNQKLPEAGANIGLNKTPTVAPAPAASSTPGAPQTGPAVASGALPDAVAAARNPAATPASVSTLSMNPEDLALRKEYELLDDRFSDLNRDTLYVEQMLQDQYELLADQKAFLSALPTRKPAIGYFTSGFGVRSSPTLGGRVKMHEGLDIANRPGTPVRAPADGVVVFTDSKSGYGQVVILDHGY